MNYTSILKPSAEKQLDHLPKPIQRRIIEKLAKIENDPRMPDSIKLSGLKNGYRTRVGVYRIVYEIDDARKIVFVTIIAHRREVYRGL